MYFHRKGILIVSLFLLITVINPINTSNANNPLDEPSYDLRDEGYDFPVKDQMGCDGGYAFAGVEAVQAAIWKKEKIKVDLSVNHALRCNWHAMNDYNNHACNGGEFRELINLFTQEGLVLASCDPFDEMNPQCKSSCETVYYVTEWQHINKFTDYLSVNEIKELLVEHGPIYAKIDKYALGFENNDGTYVVNEIDEDVMDNTHAVLIVGWDDNRSGGVWIIKNSEGSDWGDGGYGYVAYGSAGIGNDVAFVSGYRKSSPLNRLYFYDEAGHTSQMIPVGSTPKHGFALAIFPIQGEEVIRSVEIWTFDQASVNVNIYSHFENNQFGERVFQKSNVQVPNAGYYNIGIDDPIEVFEGDELVVELEVTNVNNFSPIAVDTKGDASEDRVFYKDQNGIWQPFSDIDTIQDPGIRLRTMSITEDFSKIFLPLIQR